MLVAHPLQDRLAGRWFLVPGKCHIFLAQARQRRRDLGGVSLGLGVDCHAEQRMRVHRHGQRQRMALVAQRIAGQGLLKLGHRADIAGVQLGDGLDGLAHRGADMGKPLRAAGAHTHQAGVVFQHAGVDLEVGDPPRKRVGDGLEDEGRNRLGVGDLAGDFLIAALSGNLSPGGGRGKVVNDEIQEQVGPDVVQRPGREHREQTPI